LQFEQLVGIDRDCVGLDRGRGRDRARDDLALHQQALHARIDQAGAELRQVQNADHEREQARDVEQHDAPRQARGGLRDQELPALDDRIDETAQPSTRRAQRDLGRRRSLGDGSSNIRGPIQHPLHASAGAILAAQCRLFVIRARPDPNSARTPGQPMAGRSGSCCIFAAAPEIREP